MTTLELLVCILTGIALVALLFWCAVCVCLLVEWASGGRR